MIKCFDVLAKFVSDFFSSLTKKPVKPDVPIETVNPIKDVIVCPKTPAEYEAKYKSARVLPQHMSTAASRAAIIKAHIAVYEAVENSTGVPAEIVAAIHSLESGLNFKSVLHNGEQIVGTSKKTTLVPAGKGPFATWHEAAIDALGGHGAHFNKKAWSIGQWLDFLERYNGLGYRRRGLDSPYLWSFTSEQRTAGKYIADGVWDAKAVSKQCGCVAILKALNFKLTA